LKLEQFTKFTPDERQRLDQLLSYPTRTFARRETILRDGESADSIHVVTTGLAARSKSLVDGSRQFMAFLIPGDMCDLEVFVLGEMDHDIVAVSDTTCVLIPAAHIRTLLTERSNITEALWWSTMTDSAVLREWIVNHGSRDAKARICHLLYEMLVRYRVILEAASDNSIPFPMTQDEFADATGLTPVHVNRVLGELRAEKLIELRSRTLTVLDAPRLKEVAGFEARYLHLDRTEHRDPEVSGRAEDLVEGETRGFLRSAGDALKSKITGR
jgi:CRP-like cAMP-binding protein